MSLTLAEFWATAAVLFARHPIVAVRLDDRHPMHVGTDTDPRPWVWTCYLPAGRVVHEADADRVGGNGEWHLIPSELADLGDGSTDAAGGVVAFETDDVAADWLSDRCVRFGRTMADNPR